MLKGPGSGGTDAGAGLFRAPAAVYGNSDVIVTQVAADKGEITNRSQLFKGGVVEAFSTSVSVVKSVLGGIFEMMLSLT